MANSRASKASEEMIETSEAAEVHEKKTSREEKKNLIPKDVDPTQFVYVRNGFQGSLNYKSRRTGEKFRWNEYGDEQEMELRELRNAKNTDKKFFINNWFMFEDDWVIDYLGVRQYYKNAIPIDKFDDIFKLSAEKLKERVAAMPKGQQKSVAYRAQELIREKKLDSLSLINALEEVLGFELLEK